MKRLLQSFRYAGKGIAAYAGSGKNATIHLLATVAILLLAARLGITAKEWCALVILIALVHITEAINTAIETIVDLVSPQPHPLAGKAKDIAAGAVLIAALIAVAGGCIIFIPYLAALC